MGWRLLSVWRAGRGVLEVCEALQQFADGGLERADSVLQLGDAVLVRACEGRAPANGTRDQHHLLFEVGESDASGAVRLKPDGHLACATRAAKGVMAAREEADGGGRLVAEEALMLVVGGHHFRRG